MKQYKCSTKEIDSLLKQMIIMVDTREKRNEHILNYLGKCGIRYETTTLSFGDYSFRIPLPNNESIFFHDSIVVERKASLMELSNNLAQQRERFEKELLKACKEDCKTYLMIEDAGGYDSIIQHKYSTDFKPVAYLASLQAFEAKYNINVRFISKENAGYFLCNTFKYHAREFLK